MGIYHMHDYPYPRTSVGNKARIAAERLAYSRSMFKWWDDNTISSGMTEEDLQRLMDSTWAGYWNERECR